MQRMTIDLGVVKAAATLHHIPSFPSSLLLLCLRVGGMMSETYM